MNGKSAGEDSTIIISRAPITPDEQLPSPLHVIRPSVSWWWLLENVAWAALCFGAGLWGLRFADTGWRIIGFSPHVGVMLAVLWHRGWKRCPSLLLGRLATGVVANLSPLVIIGISCVEVMSVLTGLWLLKRATKGRHPFGQLRDGCLFLGCAVIVIPTMGASLGSITMWLADPFLKDYFLELLAVRWLSLATGIALVGTLGIAWWPWPKVFPSVRQIVEMVLFAIIVVAIGVWAFARPIGRANLPIPDAALVLPLFVISMFRFGIRGSTATVFAIGAITLHSAMEDIGPFRRSGGVLVPYSLLLALENALVAASSMLLAAILVDERQGIALSFRRTDVRFRVLFENYPEAVFVADLSDGRLLEFNDRLPEMLNCSRESLLNGYRSDFEVQKLAASDRSSVISPLKSMTSEWDTEYRRSDGHTIDVNVTYSGIDYFGSSAQLMIARDVTNCRLADSILRESEQKFRRLAESIPALVSIQSHSNSSYWNPAAEAITGMSIDELKMTGFVDLLTKQYRADIQKLIQNRIKQQVVTIDRREVTLRRKDGELRNLDLSLTSMSLDSHPACLLTAIDVTARRKTEAEVRNLNSQLFHTARLRLLGEFVAGVAHDLRHPIGAINIQSDAMIRKVRREETLPIEEFRERCDRIHSQSQRALICLDRLHDLAKRHVTDRHWIDLAPLISDASRLVKMEEIWSQVPIVFVADSPRSLAFADRAEITQVLLDLMRNGLESMQSTPPTERQLSVELVRNADQVRVSITDTGCGVPDDFRDELFKPFLTTKSKGLGMGLSLCQAVVKSHEGRLWYEPANPRGSTFHFVIKAGGYVGSAEESGM